MRAIQMRVIEDKTKCTSHFKGTLLEVILIIGTRTICNT